jgi:hypothetical protein
MMKLRYHFETKEYTIEGAPTKHVFPNKNEKMELTIVMRNREFQRVIPRIGIAIAEFVKDCNEECNKPTIAA